MKPTDRNDLENLFASIATFIIFASGLYIMFSVSLFTGIIFFVIVFALSGVFSSSNLEL